MAWANVKVPELAKRSGVSTRHLRYILSGERGPTVELAEDLAGALGLKGYHLQMPNLDPSLLKNGTFDSIYNAYSEAGEDGRKVMDEYAKYISSHPKHHHNDGGNSPGKSSASS